VIALPWRDVSAQLAERSRAWAQRRQGTDSHSVELDSRRIYILPTRAGLLYGLIVIILLISSMNFSNNMGFALTFMLTGIGLVSMHHCHRNLSGLQLRLINTQSCYAGQQASFCLQLRNSASFMRWQLQTGWDKQGSRCIDLGNDTSATATLMLTSLQRGLLPAPRIAISSVFPLGLFRAWSWVHMDATAIVWPQPVSHAEQRSATDHNAATLSTQTYNGDDLSGVRDYQRGDSPRRIDWKALARYNELLVREYQDGSASKTWIDWDAVEDADTEQRLSILTRLVLDAHEQGLKYGLRIPDAVLQPNTGETHLHDCLNRLAMFGLGTTRQRVS
jgi:uncharacterized protein (DUF58 family)